MTLSEQCAFSYFVPVAPINEEHKVWMVQHAETGKFYVKKITGNYNLSVLQYLKENPAPDMPRIFELFEDDTILYIIEEYISGETLEELLASKGPFDELQVADWIHQLCVVVKYLHRCVPPIIHRDIKPSNIIVTYDGRIKLIDLSAARRSDKSKAQDTVIMGTAGYAAPEQYGFSESSEVTDIYSIGVLMNKLLIGKFPNEQIYSGSLTPIIQKCTQLEPANRYPDIKSLDADITRYLQTSQSKSLGPNNGYLPPGLRSGHLWIKVLSVAGYFLLLTITLTLNVKTESIRFLWANRIAATIAVLGIILFSGNYLCCQKYFPLSNSKNILVRLMGIFLWDFFFFLVCIVAVATFAE